MADKAPEFLRVKPGSVGALWIPEFGGYVVPDVTRVYTADDAVVKAHPAVFAPEAEVSALLRADQEARERHIPEVLAALSEPPVERATRAPGERRAAVKKDGKA